MLSARGNPNRRYVVLLMCLPLCWAQSACKDEAPVAEEGEPAVGQSDAAEPAETRLADTKLGEPEPPAGKLIPDDENDDAGAPACLPRSDSVAGWIKTNAVRLEPGAAYLQRLQDSNRAAELSPYRILEMARCTYEKTNQGVRFQVTLELLRCASPSDAFGLWSTQRTGEAVGNTGRLWANTSEDLYLLQAWQSDYYLRAEARPVSEARLSAEAERLVGRILLALPQAELPAQVRYLPSSGQLAGQQWFARSCRSLAGPGARLLTPEQAGALDRTLALGRARGLAVAAYQEDQQEPPNYVWLLECATPADAQTAYGQYKSAVDGLAAGDRSVPPVPPALLLSPVGRFLGGSWSPEQESEMHVLPACRLKLSKLEAGSI